MSLWIKEVELLNLVGRYNKLLIPGLLPFSWFNSLRGYTENLQLVKPGKKEINKNNPKI